MEDTPIEYEEMNYLLDSIDIGIVVLDESCTIRALNNSFVDLFKIKQDNFLGKKCHTLFRSLFGNDWQQLMHVHCVESDECTIRNAVKKKKRYQDEINVFLDDELPRTFNLKAASYRSSKQSTKYIVLLWYEITDRKLIENRYTSLFSDSKDMIFTALPEGTIKNINEAGVKLLGLSEKSEVIGKNLEDFFVNNEDKRYHRRILDSRGFIKDFETLLKCNDGSNRAVLETSTATKENNGKMIEYSGIIKDISDRLKTEQSLMKMSLDLVKTHEKLRNTQSQLIQREKLASLGEMAAGIAHEINNPLGFIKSNFTTLKKYYTGISEFLRRTEEILPSLSDLPDDTVRDALKEIDASRKKNGIDFIQADMKSLFAETEEGFCRIININENLMSFARSESVNKVEEISLNDAINDTLVVTKNEVKYSAEVLKDFDELPSIEGNLNQIKQVVLNIIVNAAQAIKSGKKEQRGTIRIKTENKKNAVICRICDDGPGIPRDAIDKVFDPFFTQKEVGKGTGLGLSISYDIVVNKHGGKLSVKSEEGYTCFTIELPHHQAETIE